MKFRQVLRNSKDLKKNGYKMLRKLHKMEKRKGAEKVYAVYFENTYGFVLYCRALVDIINMEYKETDEFVLNFEKKCNKFLDYLDAIADRKSKMKKSKLSGFLKAYTKFFNKVVNMDYDFSFDPMIREQWNIKCLMAYIATWGQ